MAVKSFQPVELPADPTTDPQASNKNYVDDQVATRAATSHNHAAGDVTSGTLNIARIPTGTSSATVCVGDDVRLSDARTPTAHVHAAADVTSGTLAIGRIPTGSSSSTVCIGNDSRLSDSRTPTAHNHAAADINSGTLDVARVPTGTSPTTVALGNHTHSTPLVPNPPVTLTYATPLTPVATDGNLRYVTATGDFTLNPPTSPADGQKIHIRVIASGAQRTVTFSGSFRRPASIASTLVIASGRRGDIGMMYETGDSAWTVLAATTA